MTQPGLNNDQETTGDQELSVLEHQLRDENLRTLGFMLSGFAHELNTPLGVIASLCDGMQRCHAKLAAVLDKPQLDADDHEKLKSILAHIESGTPTLQVGVERARALVRELRLAARPGEAEPPQPVSVIELLEGNTLLLGPMLRGGVTVERKFEAQPQVLGRPAMLGQVFLNLLRNAVQALGGDGTVTITVRECDGRAEVVVADNGRGLPEEILSRLFQEECTTKCPETGTGIGLFMSAKILAKHKGTITAANRPEGGAVFTVTLPLA